MMMMMEGAGLWVFGYASLLWKVGFEYDESILGFIKGFKRAFHLACFEHRGTLESPARVPTLEPDEASICWGVAYCVRDSICAQKALKYLMDRETEYDDWRYLEFFTENSIDTPKLSNVLVFMSTKTSKYYLGHAPRDIIAQQVAFASGPSGPNCDYLFRLVDALKDIGHEDDEIVELANSVKKIQCDCGIKCIDDGDGDGVEEEEEENGNIVSFNITLKNGNTTLSLFQEVVSNGLHNLSTHNHQLQPLSPRLVEAQTL